MSEGFSDPIIGGGGGLAYPSIHSPNFEAGPPIVGWSIDKNGNAFFGNVTISGSFEGTDWIINSSGAFFYSGTPANGNLILSICPVIPAGGTDGFSNTIPAAGMVSYHGGAYAVINGAELVFSGGANISQAGVGGVGMFLAGTAGTNTLQTNLPWVNGLSGIEPGTTATAETWHKISTGFPTGWGNNGTSYGIAYTFLSEAAGLVMIDIQLSVAASTAVTNGEVLATLPAGWRPNNDTPIVLGSFHNGATGQVTAILQINTNGTITWAQAGLTFPASGGSFVGGPAVYQITQA